MTSRGNWDRETGRLLERIDIPDLSDQRDVVRDYLQELASSISKIANRRWRKALERTLDTVEGTSEIMRDNPAASLVMALGVGLLIGYLIRRGTDWSDCRRARGCVTDVLPVYFPLMEWSDLLSSEVA
jgi:ElaB/YqjD/DUF883 family membrane-anchored ribosome-binding protein